MDWVQAESWCSRTELECSSIIPNVISVCRCSKGNCVPRLLLILVSLFAQVLIKFCSRWLHIMMKLNINPHNTSWMYFKIIPFAGASPISILSFGNLISTLKSEGSIKYWIRNEDIVIEKLLIRQLRKNFTRTINSRWFRLCMQRRGIVD